MNTDLAIARSITPRPIIDVAADLALEPEALELYGPHKAKITLPALEHLLNRPNPPGKIVLVTAITPTPAGEGKTTTTIGLAQALCRLGRKALCALREPSMGPVFGMKGGATGGGYAQVLPMDDINLHFTGDMHAISAAHNLLAALIDNHLHQGNTLGIDPHTITFPRVVDMNDRALRHTIIGLGGRLGGIPRESHFAITVASEVMAILCLSRSLHELKQRLGRILVAQRRDGSPVTAADLKAHGAMTAILRDAIKPNLVQTTEGTPALVHGGPFANIAHGCSSIIATLLARQLADIVVTEAGFGSDLGFEKYCHIVAPAASIPPDAVVLVATIRALKMHGGVSKKRLDIENVDALARGLINLDRHAHNVARRGVPFVIAINRFYQDTAAETATVLQHCEANGWPVALCDVWARGGEGGTELAHAVLQALQQPARFQPVYHAEQPLMEKLNAIATQVYGASKVELTPEAEQQRRWLEAHHLDRMPVCIAKTQYSFSDNPKAGPAPTSFTLHIRQLRPATGAGFIVALAGDIMTMPGLPATPAAEAIDVDENGQITGLF
ncbi:MAG: formate--tetrahydrofolate ligase [Chloroherpetonaceae bacterium]|nr:formate--tetrahydrofolate ligase [Chthonomonadaceae bacterium]MDW8208676.1 formate--tetrahydrofolate ligase [Chloroherpetonaceae bacterium]